MFGNRGIYQDGWMADDAPRTAALGDCGPRRRLRRRPVGALQSQRGLQPGDDLAAKNPEKVKELQATFLDEAKKYNVLPLDDRMAERFDASLRPNPLAGLKLHLRSGSDKHQRVGRAQYARCALQRHGRGGGRQHGQGRRARRHRRDHLGLVALREGRQADLRLQLL